MENLDFSHIIAEAQALFRGILPGTYVQDKETEPLGTSASPAICTAVIIYNPTSGQFPHHQHDHQLTLTYLKLHGWQAELWPTSAPGDGQTLARRAVEQGIDVVIAAGGDGTINEIIQGLAGSQTALAVLPTGTVNVWAREMGIPLDPIKARELIIHGQRRRVDLGQINDRYFLLMAGIGLDGEVTRAVERRPLKRLGVLGYVLAALWFGSGYLGFPVTLTVDDAPPFRTRALQIFIGNTRLYGGSIQFTWLARCDDGQLDLTVVHRRGLLGRTRILLDFALRQPTRKLWVRYQTFQRLKIETPDPVPIQVDGDAAGTTPATFMVVPGALTVILPEKLPGDVPFHM